MYTNYMYYIGKVPYTKRAMFISLELFIITTIITNIVTTNHICVNTERRFQTTQHNHQLL